MLLWNEGYCHRLSHFDLETEGVSHVYGLSDKALASLDLPPLAKSFDGRSARTLDHELEITGFHIALSRLARAHGRQLYWQRRDLKRGLHPDALFALTDPTKAEGRNTHYFFLEIEKSKLAKHRDGEPSIVRKLARYARYYDTAECEQDWNFRKFRVVVIQKTDERVLHLLRVMSDPLRLGMFWLASEARYKENLGGAIFLTPRDFAQKSHSLFVL